MSITILSQSATVGGLEDWGTPARSLSEVPCKLSGIEVDLAGAGENRTGIWECQPGSFERQLANAELMHILTGECTFTPQGGEALSIKAGDTLFFPANTFGQWNVIQTIRKVYVVMASPH
ncbi:cupin domain-containing protein [Herbaspirillum sp. alder98]|uniref:cupin domain-containing protein n=1 Tax=Herbaspirillum sp. alder98 TaxID=2913096 RepID=UPI001CD90D05|nr:cupin domain-containing protein [Herbaspirillum sp. alder98]MCA1326750.1 cupin domain-containing protein [Herbaspirillum sp. alder98]